MTAATESATATIREIAEALALPERTARDRASKGGWSWAEEVLPTGAKRRVYALATLPREVRVPVEKHRGRALLAAAAPAPTPAPVRTADLKAWQRSPAEARAALLAEIDRLVATGVSQGRAINALVDGAQAGTLSADLMALVPVANARAGAGRTLTRATLYNWLKARQAAPDAVAALAPAGGGEAPPPVWAATLLRLWGRPTKPNLTECLDDSAWPADEAKPSYHQARRFLQRLDAISRHTGRLGPRALKSMRAYIARDVSQLWPGAVFIGDGHTFKREVQHPIHGRPFRPEITAFLDVYTRRWVGWSVALAENTWSVADALRHAVTTATTPDIVYYDNGSGAKNTVWDDAATGLIARLGITKHHSAPWSSQARGVIERFNSTVLHRLARRAPTYVGERMDQEARQRVFKLTRAQIREAGSSPVLTAWVDLVAELQAEQDAYNARPHSFLGTMLDPATGKRRHMSPNEAWDKAVAEGWQPDRIPADQAADLFRPAERRKVSRGLVTLMGNEYFHQALEVLHGEDVVVGYDIHDASRVWVRLPDGRVVCEAVWGGNKRSYVPVAVAEQAREQRVKGKVARLDRHRMTALAELNPGVLIEHAAQPTPIGAAEAARLAAFEAEMVVPAEVVPLPRRDTREQRFARALEIEQHQAAGSTVPAEDAQWLARYRQLPEYRAMRGMYDDFGEAMFA